MTAGSRAVEVLYWLLCAWSWDLSWCLGRLPASASPNHGTTNPMSLSQWQSMPTFLLSVDTVQRANVEIPYLLSSPESSMRTQSSTHLLAFPKNLDGRDFYLSSY